MNEPLLCWVQVLLKQWISLGRDNKKQAEVCEAMLIERRPYPSIYIILYNRLSGVNKN